MGWVYLGTGVTAAVGAMAIISGVDARNHHQSFVDAGCMTADYPSCDNSATSGRAAVLRTNILAGSTIALGALTILTLVVALSGGDAR
jgi:hypothetical protein